MQTVLLEHPNRAVGEEQTGDFGKDWEVVDRIIVIN